MKTETLFQSLPPNLIVSQIGYLNLVDLLDRKMSSHAGMNVHSQPPTCCTILCHGDITLKI